MLFLQFFCNTKETALSTVKNTKQTCINFIKSGTCIIIMIVMLSLAIFMIQLFQWYFFINYIKYVFCFIIFSQRKDWFGN